MNEFLVDPPLRRANQLGLGPTRHLLVVSVTRQEAALFESDSENQTALTSDALRPGPAYRMERTFPCSTSKFGVGQTEGSNRTPVGLHRVARKIGDGCAPGTVFKGRQVVGHVAEGMPDAAITTRILWLEGLEPGLNQGGEVDSFRRYIYIHGTADQSSIGRPASRGCVHLADADLVPLFDRLEVGTLVWIEG